ncbi:MAG TPA: ATP phosphoribosyltransferase [Candidatus Thermoplasmatota archaeon]|nr:ATP phosphoribosyltransferase [Candidatus Thermoplasmatota archaeon]
MTRALRIAIPNKGRLADEAVELLRRAGITLQGLGERSLFATALGGRLQVLFLRARDIPGFVAEGTVDAGMTGADQVAEADAHVDRRLDLAFGACRLVLAVPEASGWRKAADLPDEVRVATSFEHLTRAYFHRMGRKARIVPVSGAVEITPTLGIADAVTDLTQSGSTLATNRLRAIDTLLTSTCWLIAAPRLAPEIAEELERLQFALASVLAARGKRYLMADLPRAALDEASRFLPGVEGPTVVDIAGRPGLVAIQVVVDEADIYDAVHRLKRLGATGVLVLPIDRMVP